jgi:hypothetical protein
MLLYLIRVPYFVYILRLMFSCNLRQRNEGISVAQHVSIVLLYKAVSEYLVDIAVATTVKALVVV